MAIERLTVNLPDGFDPNRHVPGLIAKVAEVKGPGWELDSTDPDAGTAVLTRQAVTTEVRSTNRIKSVNLPRGTKPADGDKIAARFEDAHPGFFLTSFEPYLGKATLTKLSDDEARCRGAVALALGVKPWEVQVRSGAGGGFELELPRTYVPSKHLTKLEEVATVVVGREGWYVAVDTKALTARIVPSDPPTFAPMIPYPFERTLSPGDWSIPIGQQLAEPGQDAVELALDFDATPGALVVGTAGSGKSVTVGALIAGALLRGFELAIGDVPHKAVDFTWCKEFCRTGGWGCDSPEQTLTMLRLIYEEGQARARLLAEHDVQKIQELPGRLRPRPILVVLDEVTGMFALEEVPKGIGKDHPLVQEALSKNLVIQLIKSTVAKIPAELRFVGIRIIVATQMAQANTGISVPLKTNLANRMLLGSNPNEAARAHAFLDPRSAPVVPENIKADQKAARGVGVAEFEGQPPVVFKSYVAQINDYREHLRRAGTPTTSRPEPTAAQVAKHTPSLDQYDDSRPASRLDSGGWGAPDGRDAPEPRLRGAAAAAHALKTEAAAHASGATDLP